MVTCTDHFNTVPYTTLTVGYRLSWMEHAEMQGTDSTLPCHGARDLQRHGGTPHSPREIPKALFLVDLARQSFYLEVHDTSKRQSGVFVASTSLAEKVCPL